VDKTEIVEDFACFCKLAVKRKAVPALGRGWKWKEFLQCSAEMVLYSFEEEDAVERYKRENPLSVVMGGRSLRFQADLIMGPDLADGDKSLSPSASIAYFDRKDAELVVKAAAVMRDITMPPIFARQVVGGSCENSPTWASHVLSCITQKSNRDMFSDIGGVENWVLFVGWIEEEAVRLQSVQELKQELDSGSSTSTDSLDDHR
tara:strand:- start:2545 stop:3156 length:612 start_codon:yes stop_codon:yes gene_type:complete